MKLMYYPTERCPYIRLKNLNKFNCDKGEDNYCKLM